MLEFGLGQGTVQALALVGWCAGGGLLVVSSGG